MGVEWDDSTETGGAMAGPTREELDHVVRGRTVPGQFLDTARRRGDAVALRWTGGDGGGGELSFRQYADQAGRVAGALAGLGLRRGQRVVLMLRNRPEFHVADMAVLLAGGTPVSLYNSSSPEQVRHLVDHAEATIAVVDDACVLERFLVARPAHLEHLVVVDGPVPGAAGARSWSDLLEAAPVPLDSAAGAVEPDDAVTVIYTSGTTGPPKGVVLSHYNVCFTVESLRRRIGWESGEGRRLVSYLPMAHIAERMVSHYQQAVLGYEVTSCPDPTQLAAYLPQVRPQLFFGVPRVWEKLHAGVKAALAAKGVLELFDDGVTTAGPIAAARAALGPGAPLPDELQQQWDLLDFLAFRQVRELLGLDRVEVALSGAAPLPVPVFEWFRAIGVPLSELYGMSESSGPITWEPHHVRAGTVGTAIPGCEVRLLEDGEVVCRGGNVFLGYLKEPERTREALDEDGWLHTGDVGRLDGDGHLRIVDRKKELIITAAGKNVSPANVESALKACPLVGQAAVVGDGRPYLCALVVLDPDVAPAWARGRGLEATATVDLARHPEVRAEIARAVEEVNRRFSRPEQVKRFLVLGDEWLPDSEELTPTMKLKRRAVERKYAAQIEALYLA